MRLQEHLPVWPVCLGTFPTQLPPILRSLPPVHFSLSIQAPLSNEEILLKATGDGWLCQRAQLKPTICQSSEGKAFPCWWERNASNRPSPCQNLGWMTVVNKRSNEMILTAIKYHEINEWFRRTIKWSWLEGTVHTICSLGFSSYYQHRVLVPSSGMLLLCGKTHFASN